MAKPIFILAMVFVMILQANALMPYTRPLYDIIFPSEDPFRILEQTPLTIPKNLETIALARSDWKETATAHVISLDIPGLKKDDIKIEVEENRVLRITVPKFADQEKKRQPKVINIDQEGSSGEDIKATKAEM
ncbi:hypothetical protein Q3G72_021269 [Acer saccharum]|nr:hypothetical protein Q3G72_021269 [Acer saccharum]